MQARAHTYIYIYFAFDCEKMTYNSFSHTLLYVQEKQMKQKMLDEVAKAVIAKNGVPLSISEHEALVSQIKSEAAQAHAEMLESKGMIPNSMF